MVDELETQETVTDPVTDPLDDKTQVPIGELRKVRHEAAEYRKKLEALEKQAQAEKEKLRLASLDDVARAQELLKKAEVDNDNLRKSMNRIQVETAITSLAMTLGFTAPDDVIKFIDLESVKDEQGNVDDSKIEVAVKDLADKKPYLRSKPSALSLGGGATNPANPESPGLKPKLTDPNTIAGMKQQARDMTRQGRITEATKLYNIAWEHEQKHPETSAEKSDKWHGK